METPINNKLSMFKAVERICFTHHGSWDNNPSFGSVLSRFVLKVAQLELLLATVHSEKSIKLEMLISEIELLLHTRIDALVALFQEQQVFFSHYHRVRQVS